MQADHNWTWLKNYAPGIFSVILNHILLYWTFRGAGEKFFTFTFIQMVSPLGSSNSNNLIFKIFFSSWNNELFFQNLQQVVSS